MKKTKHGYVVVKPNGDPMWWSFADTAESAVWKVTKNYPLRTSSGKVTGAWAERVNRGYKVCPCSRTIINQLDS